MRFYASIAGEIRSHAENRWQGNEILPHSVSQIGSLSTDVLVALQMASHFVVEPCRAEIRRQLKFFFLPA
jgi:hypothetical protein